MRVCKLYTDGFVSDPKPSSPYCDPSTAADPRANKFHSPPYVIERCADGYLLSYPGNVRVTLVHTHKVADCVLVPE